MPQKEGLRYGSSKALLPQKEGLRYGYYIQGAVAAWAQEGLEELSHIEGQEGRW